MILEIVEIIKAMPATDIISLIEIGAILGGITVSVLALRARVRMKRARASRMLWVWTRAIIVRMGAHGKKSTAKRRRVELTSGGYDESDKKRINFADTILPTHIYDGLVTSGLIAHLDEGTQQDADYLYQLVYAHNKDGNAKSRMSRFNEMVEYVFALYEVVDKDKNAYTSKWRVVARLFD